MPEKIAVALSGGVDSSVTAFLLKEKGYNVVGVTAKTTDSPAAEKVIQNASEVAKKLQIPFYPLDVTDIFKEKVINYFENSYKSGMTPNPCIMCNKYMKWGTLFDFAINELKADYIATGHYAKIKKTNGLFKLYPASDEHKDQLYFLFMLEQEHLKKTLFPLSEYTKSEVRKLAYDNDLPSKSSKESQDICFIQSPMTTKKYLNSLIPPLKGYFVEESTGKKLGEHTGFWQFTIGQRKGIGLAAPEALYVTSIDAATNTVYVGYKDKLFSDKLFLKNVNWNYPINKQKFESMVKIRYNMKAVPAEVEILGSDAVVAFPQRVSAVAAGQACVIYDKQDGHLIGGAFIQQG